MPMVQMPSMSKGVMEATLLLLDSMLSLDIRVNMDMRFPHNLRWVLHRL